MYHHRNLHGDVVQGACLVRIRAILFDEQNQKGRHLRDLYVQQVHGSSDLLELLQRNLTVSRHVGENETQAQEPTQAEGREVASKVTHAERGCGRCGPAGAGALRTCCGRVPSDELNGSRNAAAT